MIWKLIINTHVASALQKNLLMIAIINLLEGKYCLNTCKQIVIFVPVPKASTCQENSPGFSVPGSFYPSDVP